MHSFVLKAIIFSNESRSAWNSTWRMLINILVLKARERNGGALFAPESKRITFDTHSKWTRARLYICYRCHEVQPELEEA